MSDTPRRKPWIPHRPEQRLSVFVNRLLEEALTQPFYATAIHDADEGQRTDQQRSRDKDRGQKSGQLDWKVMQFPGLYCEVELKRGRNGTSANQEVTIGKIKACGFDAFPAWTLREVHAGLAARGFRFAGNVETSLQKYEAMLAAADRNAELITSGAVTRKAPRPATQRRSAKARGGMTSADLVFGGRR